MSPRATLEVRHPGHHEICLVWAPLVPMCLADAVWGQAHGDGRRQEQRRDDIKQKAGQIWLQLHFLLWITKRPSVFGTVGQREYRETKRETDIEWERGREGDRNWERERVIFAQRGHAPQSGLSLSPVLTPVCVCCGKAENRGMCEAFVNTNMHTGTHRDTHTKSTRSLGFHLHRYRHNALALAITCTLTQKNYNYRHMHAPVSHSVFKWNLHKAFGGFSSSLFLSPAYI